MSESAWWDLWNRSYRAKDDLDPVSTELFERVASVIADVTGPSSCSVLEIGCGSGTLSRLLSCSSYHGIDISPAAIDLARQKAERITLQPSATQPNYHVADIHDWPIPSMSLDLVICVDAIAYFRDQPLTLRKMSAGLRPGGRLILTTINPFVYDRIKRTNASPLQEGAVSHWLSRAELHSLVRSAGFCVEHSCTIMPRGNRGILRIVNSWRLNQALGPFAQSGLKRLKEQVGLGQYRLLVGRKAEE